MGSYWKVVVVAAALTLPAFLPAAGGTEDLDALYQSNRWFDFRDAMAQGTAPAFYRGELALRFHDWKEAEKEFLAVMKSAADPVQSFEAGLGLEEIYELSGRLKDARALFSRMDQTMRSLNHARNVDSQSYRDFKAYREAVEVLDEYPDQTVTARGRSRLTYTEVDNELIIPLKVNGTPANYMIDSGSSLSFVSEAEAKRIGLTVHRAPVPFDNFDAEDHQAIGVGVANDLVIGNFHLRNVLFLVDKGDDSDGIIGMPVLLALETLRWSSDGTIEFGFPAEARNVHESNLCLVDGILLTRAELGNRSLVMALDTGSYESFMMPRFAEDFAGLMKTRIRVAEHDLGIGSIDKRTSILPEVSMHIGGLRTRLNPARVLSIDPLRDSRDAQVWLGMDLLGQARSVTLDLGAMKLTLDGIDVAPRRESGTEACALPQDFACAPGFKCIVKSEDDTPCFVDRVPVEAWPGNSTISDGEPDKRCVLPTGANCGSGKVCRAVFDSTGSCHIVQEDAAPAGVEKVVDSGRVSGVVAPGNVTSGGSPNARELMRRVLKYDSLDLAPARDYIYVEEKEEKTLGKDGSVSDTSTETREVMNLYDMEYARLIRKDGKELPANKARAEQARFDKAVEKRTHETAEAKAKREEADRKDAVESLVCEDEFLKTFDFRTAGAETVNGRPAWIVEANPVPHQAPHCHSLKTLDKFHFKLWIDEAEFRTARWEGDNIAPVTFAAVLVRLPTGGLHAVFEQARHADGVWLESRLQANINARALLVLSVRQEIVRTYTNYRKFHSDSRMMPVDDTQ